VSQTATQAYDNWLVEMRDAHARMDATRKAEREFLTLCEEVVGAIGSPNTPRASQTDLKLALNRLKEARADEAAPTATAEQVTALLDATREWRAAGLHASIVDQRLLAAIDRVFPPKTPLRWHVTIGLPDGSGVVSLRDRKTGLRLHAYGISASNPEMVRMLQEHADNLNKIDP